MKHLVNFTLVLALFFNVVSASAQDPVKKRKSFSYNDATQAELGFTAEQTKKMEELKKNFGIDATKVQEETRLFNAGMERKQDSILTVSQRQKAMAIKDAIKTQNQENPALKKTFSYDQKTMDEMGLSADQQQKLTAFVKEDTEGKRMYAKKITMVVNDALKNMEEVLTDVQKKKVTEMKAAIDEYNKNLK